MSALTVAARKWVSLSVAGALALSVVAAAAQETAEPTGVVLNQTANVIVADIQTSNGVIHVIDEVLVPPTGVTEATAEATGVGEVAATAQAEIEEAAATVQGQIDETSATVEAEIDEIVATLEVQLEEQSEMIDEVLGEGTAEAGATDQASATAEADATPEGDATAEADNPFGLVGGPDVTIADVLSGSPEFSNLVSALDAAGLTSLFAEPGNYTVFAPTNEAFETFAADQGLTVSDLLVDTTALSDVLTYHVLAEAYTSDQLLSVTSVTTLYGGEITVTVGDGGTATGDSDLEATDEAGNAAGTESSGSGDEVEATAEATQGS